MRPLAFLCLAVTVAAAAASGPAQALDPAAAQRAQGRDARPEAASPFAPRAPSRPEARGQAPARDAVKRGDIRPLEEVTARVQSRYPGRLLDVRLNESNGRWIYYVKILTREGRVLDVAVDARTAQIIGVAGNR